MSPEARPGQFERLARGDLAPEVRVSPPGPQSRALAARLAAHEAPATNTLGPRDEASVVWSEALGANVLDVDGNLYLDMTGGFGVAAVGHRHPRVVAAIAEQAERLLHGLGDVAAHPTRIALGTRLATLAPVDEPRVHFAVSGADAVEIALKTAVAATGRRRLVAFDPGYHGTTLGALALTSRPAFRALFVDLLTPHVARLPFGVDATQVGRALESGDVAALIVEPVVGREGVLLPPPGWLAELARLCRRHGTLLIADEILTGFGRTGELFAVDHEGVRPDLLCCGKALGGGLPIAAVVGERRWMEVWRRAGGGGDGSNDAEALHTGTFIAHPLACAAALATLDLIESEGLIARARAIGARFERAAPVWRAAPRVVEVRGIGALWAIELESAGAAAALVEQARAAGLLLLAGGPAGRVVELAPPLVLTAAQLDLACARLGAILGSSDALTGVGHE